MSEITNQDIDRYINRITRENGGVDPTRTFTTQMYYDGRFRNQLRVIDINNRIVDLYNPETAQVLGRAVLDSVNCITLEQDMTDFNNFCIDHLSRLAVLTHTVQEEERKVSFFLSHVIHFNVYFRLEGIWIPPPAQTANHISGRLQKQNSNYFLSVRAPDSENPQTLTRPNHFSDRQHEIVNLPVLNYFIYNLFQLTNAAAAQFQQTLRKEKHFIPQYNTRLPENGKKMVKLYIRKFIVTNWWNVQKICNNNIPLLISTIEGFNDPHPILEHKYLNKIISDQIKIAEIIFNVEMPSHAIERYVEQVVEDITYQYEKLFETQRQRHTPFDRDDAFKPIDSHMSIR